LFNSKDPNNERLSFWKHKKNGSPVFDANFDLSPEANQIKLYQLCQLIKKSKYLYKDENLNTFDCPLERIKIFAEKQGIRFPIPREQFNITLSRYQNILKDKGLRVVNNQLRAFIITLKIQSFD